MSLDLKRQLIAQLVESSRLLRNYHRSPRQGPRHHARAVDRAVPVAASRKGLSQVDLAEVLELQPISLVRLLDRLVEHGLLERRHDPQDRRANRLFLTASGRQLVDDLDSLRDSIAADVLQDIPAASIADQSRDAAGHQGPHQGLRRARRHRRQVIAATSGCAERPDARRVGMASRHFPTDPAARSVVTGAGVVHITARTSAPSQRSPGNA